MRQTQSFFPERGVRLPHGPHGPVLRCAQARPITVFGLSVFSEGGKGSKQEVGDRWGPCVLGEMSCGHTTDFEGGSSDWAPLLEGPKLGTSVHLVLLRLLQQITVGRGGGLTIRY